MTEETIPLRERLGLAFQAKAKSVKATSFWIKVLLIAGGAFVSGGAAFFSSDTLTPLSSSQIIGLVGLVLVLIGTVFVIVTEEDSTDALEEARYALDEATNQSLTAHEVFDELVDYESAVGRLSALYYAMTLGRGTVEQAVLHSVDSEDSLIDACLEACKGELKVALGLQYGQVWTLCIYRAVRDSIQEYVELELIAHDRSVACSKENARRWREGVGVGGLAYAKNDEVVVPDLDDPGVGTVFRLDEDLAKPEDRDRYKSLFAVPVEVGQDKRPWGVVLATNDTPEFFGSDENVGVDPEEAVRALAGIVALAVAVCRTKNGQNMA